MWLHKTKCRAWHRLSFYTTNPITSAIIRGRLPLSYNWPAHRGFSLWISETIPGELWVEHVTSCLWPSARSDWSLWGGGLWRSHSIPLPLSHAVLQSDGKEAEAGGELKGRRIGGFLLLLRQGNVCNYAIKAHYHRLIFFVQPLNSIN